MCECTQGSTFPHSSMALHVQTSMFQKLHVQGLYCNKVGTLTRATERNKPQ